MSCCSYYACGNQAFKEDDVTVSLTCTKCGDIDMHERCYNKMMKYCVAVINKNCTTLNESETLAAVWTTKRDLVFKKSPGLLKCQCGGYLSRDGAERNELKGLSPSKAGKQKRVDKHLNRHLSAQSRVATTTSEREKKHAIELDKDTLNRYEWKRSNQSSGITDLFSNLSMQAEEPEHVPGSGCVEDFPTLPNHKDSTDSIVTCTTSTTTEYSKAASARSQVQQKQELQDYIHRDPNSVMNSWKAFEFNKSNNEYNEYHGLHMSIMWFDDYDSTLRWKSKIVGKGGSHIEEIEDTYEVNLSLRNRANELHLFCFNGDISTRKNCFEYVKKKIGQYSQQEWR